MKSRLLSSSRAQATRKVVIRVIVLDVRRVRVFVNLVLTPTKEDSIVHRSRRKAVSVLRVLAPAYRMVLPSRVATSLAQAIVLVQATIMRGATSLVRKVTVSHAVVTVSLARVVMVSLVRAAISSAHNTASSVLSMVSSVQAIVPVTINRLRVSRANTVSSAHSTASRVRKAMVSLAVAISSVAVMVSSVKVVTASSVAATVSSVRAVTANSAVALRSSAALTIRMRNTA